MEEINPLRDVASVINEQQEISLNELEDTALSMGISRDGLKLALEELERSKIIASRNSGGIVTYYVLDKPTSLNKVVIVEDDKNINKLMSIAIGKELETRQVYDGGLAIQTIREFRPDLVILDLMLPNKDGLDICNTIKNDPEISGTTVIIVSAMDPTSNRFKGIKYGADYYIKKPFDPTELRNLVTLFLKKKGKKFNPLIDLPDEERISRELETLVRAGESYVIGKLKIENFGAYAEKFGEQSAMTMLRLISQLLQDAITGKDNKEFVGFLNTDEFMIVGQRESVNDLINVVTGEFNAVLPFILQDQGYKYIDLNIDTLFETNALPKPELQFSEIEMPELLKRRAEVLKSKRQGKDGSIGAYTYDELQRMFGNDDLDIHITRETGGIKLHVSKKTDKG